MTKMTHTLYRNGVTMVLSGTEAECRRWLDTMAELNDLDYPDWVPADDEASVQLSIFNQAHYEIHAL